MLRNGDFLLLPALIWAAALPAPGRSQAPGRGVLGGRGRGTPSTARCLQGVQVLTSILPTKSTATCLASRSPQSLETSSPGDPGRWREINAGSPHLCLLLPSLAASTGCTSLWLRAAFHLGTVCKSQVTQTGP